MAEVKYERSAAAARIRNARERAGLSVEVVAATMGLGRMEYCDLERDDDDAFMSICLDELGRLAGSFGLEPVEIVGPSGSAVTGGPVPMEDVILGIKEQLRERSESVEMFEERIGWDVEGALRDPQQAWRDWSVDCLQDVCRAVGMSWVRVLASWTPTPG